MTPASESYIESSELSSSVVTYESPLCVCARVYAQTLRG